MTTPKHTTTTGAPKLTPDEARQATIERPVFKVLIASLILAVIAAIVLSAMFQF